MNPDFEKVSQIKDALDHAAYSVTNFMVEAQWKGLDDQDRENFGLQYENEEDRQWRRLHFKMEMYEPFGVREGLKKLMQQKEQEKVLIDYFNRIPDEESFISIFPVMSKWINGIIVNENVRKPVITVGIGNMAHVFLNSLIRLATEDENDPVNNKFCISAASLFAKYKAETKPHTGELFCDTFMEDLDCFAMRDLQKEDPFRIGNIKYGDEKARDSALAVISQLIRNKTLDPSYWYRKSIARSPNCLPAETDISFIRELYKGLTGQGEFETEEYFPNKDKGPEKYFNDVVLIINSVLKRAADPDSINSQNAQIILRELKKFKDIYTGVLPYSGYLRLANILTIKINDSGGIKVPTESGGITREQLKMLDPRKVDEMPEAFRRFLYVIHKDSNQFPQDIQMENIVFSELVEIIMERGLKMKKEQKVITLGDLAVRFPKATGPQIKAIRDRLQNGANIHTVHEWYRELLQMSGGRVFWNRWEAGKGILS